MAACGLPLALELALELVPVVAAHWAVHERRLAAQRVSARSWSECHVARGADYRVWLPQQAQPMAGDPVTAAAYPPVLRAAALG